MTGIILALAAWLVAQFTTIADTLETALLDLVFRNIAYTGNATLYVKLHLADPGEAGTASPAAHTTRAPVTFAAASAGSIASNSAATFTSMVANETISHISLWDASTAGVCKWTGPLTTPKAVAIGDDFTIPSGSLTVTLD